MKNIVLVLIAVIAVMIMACPVRADGEEPPIEETIVTTEEVAPEEATFQEPVQASVPQDEIILRLLEQIEVLTA